MNVVKWFDDPFVVSRNDYEVVVGGRMPNTARITDPESLGRVLQQARLITGLSQRELAERMGTSQRYIWEIEAGKPSIFVRRLFAMMSETQLELTATIATEDERG